MQFQRKASTCTVAFFVAKNSYGYKVNHATRAIKESGGWRIDKSCYVGAWTPWEPIDTTVYPTITAAKKAIRAFAAATKKENA